MRLFVSGSRNWKKGNEIIREKLLEYRDCVVLVGDCYGVDYEVMKICKELNIRCYVFFVNKIRNNVGFKCCKVEGYRFVDKDIKMSEMCDKGLVFWDGVSKGSKNNIDRLKRMNKEVEIIV